MNNAQQCRHLIVESFKKDYKVLTTPAYEVAMQSLEDCLDNFPSDNGDFDDVLDEYVEANPVLDEKLLKLTKEARTAFFASLTEEQKQLIDGFFHGFDFIGDFGSPKTEAFQSLQKSLSDEQIELAKDFVSCHLYSSESWDTDQVFFWSNLTN